MRNNTVDYPEMRNAIVQSLKWLTQKDIQKCINPPYPHSFWDNLRYPLEIFLEDLELDQDDIEEHIEKTLYDKEECQAVKKVGKYLDNLVEELGWQKPDSVYLNWYAWNELVKAAKEALKLLSENNHKYNFIYKDL